MEELGDPQDRWPSIHVAGTNGKGSVTAFCAAILNAAGFRTGRYHSPYVFDLRERIMIGSEMISQDDFAALMTRVVPLADAIESEELGPVTEFELKTAVAFRYFADQGIDIGAIETGLGGRLDATNVLLPRVAVVTNIGLDHTEILGETVREIAREKAGIIKPGSRLVTAALHPDALDILQAISREMMSGLTHVRPAEKKPMVFGRSVVYWWDDGLNVRSPRIFLRGMRPRMGGAYQLGNAATAIAAVECFSDSYEIDVPADAYAEGIRAAWLPGRMQQVMSQPRVILDGAHNRDAAAVLRTAAMDLAGEGKLHVVLGISKGHDAERFLAALAPITGSLILVQPSDARGLPVEDLVVAAEELGLTFEVADSVPLGVENALSASRPEDTVLVTGSFYTVHDCASLVDNKVAAGG